MEILLLSEEGDSILLSEENAIILVIRSQKNKLTKYFLGIVFLPNFKKFS